jgi:hypothetical protein
MSREGLRVHLLGLNWNAVSGEVIEAAYQAVVDK